MSYWTRQTILQLYRNHYPSRGDARIITDNMAGSWAMWICYGDGHQHYFSYNMGSEQAALNNALEMLRNYEDYEHDDSDDSDDPDDSDEEESDEEESDEEESDEEESDDDDLHDSDSDDPNDQGDYGEACFSDDEEDFDPRNNWGNPHSWNDQDDSNGFFNGVGQVGSYERIW